MCLFNHHPNISKICTKAGFQKLIGDYKIFNKSKMDYIPKT